MSVNSPCSRPAVDRSSETTAATPANRRIRQAGQRRPQSDRFDRPVQGSLRPRQRRTADRPRLTAAAIAFYDDRARSIGRWPIARVLAQSESPTPMQGPVAIILAAGQGKRMKSEKAKVLHEVCGQPMIRYVVDAARGAGAQDDRRRGRLRGRPGPRLPPGRARHPLRDPDRAARHRPCRQGLPAAAGRLSRARRWSWSATSRCSGPSRWPTCSSASSADQAACLLGTAVLPDPTGFGRILRDSAGRFLRIVEERDCTPEERAITEVNPSCYVFELPGLWDALDQIGTSNAQGEYYLTDAPEHPHDHGPQGPGAQRPRSPTTSSASTPASTSPRRRRSCRRGSRTTG